MERMSASPLSTSEIFSLDSLPVKTMPNGARRWNILSGVLPTGEALEVHESLQPPGIPPNPAHSIKHSELILVLEGTLQFDYDGRSEKIGAGGIIFVAYGTMHSARNIGDGPARYVVVAIGGDAK